MAFKAPMNNSLETKFDQNQLLSPKDNFVFHNNKLKILAAFCALAMGFGDSFTLGTFPVLKGILKKDLNINNSQFESIQSSSTLPGTFIPFIVGALMSKFGHEYGCLASSLLIFIGGLVISSVSFTHNYEALLIGKVINGFGSSLNYVSATTLIAYWFKEEDLAKMLGLMTFASSFILLFSTSTTLFLYERYNFYGISFFISNILSLIGLISACLYYYFLKKSTKSQRIVGIPNEKVEIKNMLKFKFGFWIIAFVAFFFEASQSPFSDSLVDFLSVEFGLTKLSASSYASFILITGMVLCIPIGSITDKSKSKDILLLLSNVLYLVSMLLLGLTNVHPGISLFLNAIPTVAVPIIVFSIIPSTVKKEYISTATGLLVSLSSMSDTIFDVLSGVIQDNDNQDYRNVMIFWILLSAIPAGLSLMYVFYCRFTSFPKTKPDVDSKTRTLGYVFSCISVLLFIFSLIVYVYNLV